MIKYIGSKRALLPHILRAVAAAAGQGVPFPGAPTHGTPTHGTPTPRVTVADLFSGTARVGHALKAAGYRVLANDQNAYAHALAACYVQADAERWAEPARRLLDELQGLPGRPGWFTATFCEQARFLHPRNGARVDAIRERIAALALPPELEAVLLVSLMEAADRVDSTAGVQMAYMKRWAPRAERPLALRLPALLPRPAAGPCRATLGDAEQAAAAVEADIAYLDPPYNQHSYLGNYHVWESLVRWDKPEVFGVACKRVDVRTRKSAFNSRPGILPALTRTVAALRCPSLIVSFSDDGWVDRPTLEALLRARGHLAVLALPHPRYVGARIGIYNGRGEKVGTPGRLRNTEYLYVVTPEPLPGSLAEGIAGPGPHVPPIAAERLPG